MRRLLKRLITPPLLLLAALFFVAEGLLWRLAALYALLVQAAAVRQLESAVRQLPPYGALALFALPAISLAPIKFLALYWIAGGHPPWAFPPLRRPRWPAPRWWPVSIS